MKSKILVDMDGVLADVYTPLIHLEYQQSGILLTPRVLYGKLEEKAFPSFYKHIRSKGFFRTAPRITDSVEGLRYLNDKYNVLIVSSATEFPDSLTEKLEWLNEFYPFITWEQMIFCGRKDSIQGDVMIDDHIKNLGSFNGKKILFTQPHNVYVDDKTLHRVSGWNEIAQKLL
ncbi:MAG: 5'(3')-deoxyribonucleotidase [Tannerella sp.]|jgi:5'(3')-deoxyribonucleotidase|nr:5'(3')-deoxyribonucleotidase [Tannerella sp.]